MSDAATIASECPNSLAEDEHGLDKRRHLHSPRTGAMVCVSSVQVEALVRVGYRPSKAQAALEHGKPAETEESSPASEGETPRARRRPPAP